MGEHTQIEVNWGDAVGDDHCAGGGVGGWGNDYDECTRCQILNLFISDTTLLCFVKGHYSAPRIMYCYYCSTYILLLSYLVSFYALIACSCHLTMHTNW